MTNITLYFAPDTCARVPMTIPQYFCDLEGEIPRVFAMAEQTMRPNFARSMYEPSGDTADQTARAGIFA
jgi:hypothetical protein